MVNTKNNNNYSYLLSVYLVTEKDRLEEVEEEWTKLLDRHQAKLAMLGGKQ
jgi:hypothetical protein